MALEESDGKAIKKKKKKKKKTKEIKVPLKDIYEFEIG